MIREETPGSGNDDNSDDAVRQSAPTSPDTPAAALVAAADAEYDDHDDGHNGIYARDKEVFETVCVFVTHIFFISDNRNCIRNCVTKVFYLLIYLCQMC